MRFLQLAGYKVKYRTSIIFMNKLSKSICVFLVLSFLSFLGNTNTLAAESTQSTTANFTDQINFVGVVGPVKSVTQSDGFWEESWMFDVDGRLIKIGQNNITDTNSKRDGSGRLIFYEREDMNAFEEIYVAKTFYSYDSYGRLITESTECDEEVIDGADYQYNEHGRLIQKCIGNEYDTFTESYKYDSEGRVISVTRENVVGLSTTFYKYISFDSYGNWTKRVVTDSIGDERTETREIIYY